jgi:hypothetical protein
MHIYVKIMNLIRDFIKQQCEQMYKNLPCHDQRSKHHHNLYFNFSVTRGFVPVVA